MTKENVNKILEVIKKTPVINVTYKIANAYASGGKPTHIKETAKFSQWRSRIGNSLVFSMGIGLLLTVFFYWLGDTETRKNFNPEDAILSIFPDILGFGIGVFALLFALPHNFLSNESNNKKSISLHMLPVDLAYPLLVYCLIMLFAVFFRVFPDVFLTTWFSTAFLIYGFLVTLELISTLFSTASYLITKKISDSKKINEESKKDK